MLHSVQKLADFIDILRFIENANATCVIGAFQVWEDEDAVYAKIVIDGRHLFLVNKNSVIRISRDKEVYNAE